MCNGTGYDKESMEDDRFDNPYKIIISKSSDDPPDFIEKLEEEFGDIEENGDEIIIPVDPDLPNIITKEIRQKVENNLIGYSKEDKERFMHGFDYYYNYILSNDKSLEVEGAKLASEITDDEIENIQYREKEKMAKRIEELRGRPAIIRLKRLPKNEELEIEAHEFLDSFFNQSTGNNFTAYIRDLGDRIVLDGWYMSKADWFDVIEDGQK